MSTLQNKIDFVAFISVRDANPNGDPLGGNLPRTDYDGYGEITSECIKRKIRNRMQDLGNSIFGQSEDRTVDGFTSYQKRFEDFQGTVDKDVDLASAACEEWLDVRSFGQVFAYSGKDKNKGVSIGVRGPVSIGLARSVDPVEIRTYQITKSANGVEAKKDSAKASDRVGSKSTVEFGVYKISGAINVQLAEKTGFSDEDAEVIKNSLATLFVNDASAARPEGSMEVVKLYWFKHNCKDGQYSSAKVHRAVTAVTNDSGDYDFCVDTAAITGLSVEDVPCV